MKILNNSIRLFSVVLSFSVFSIAGVSAVTPFETSSQSTEPLLAQTNTNNTTTQLTIKPPLTSEQKAKAKVIDAKYQPLIQAAANKYRKSMQELEAIIGTNPSDEVIRSKYNQVKEDRGELTDLLIESLIEVRGILTPEQQASLSKDIRRLLDTQ
ncbi:hypothetical protein C7H19_17790 [Aphanothece hegewaldii CCALA 016]|uniref:Uncharacterized protein n=1 Tax=Aphanothece hegewaldii CCALA 016 TaxID=2107694 RepID=A0A2T1LU68_9CHRO|nr:Spy/CpxP family protein refolding chaperone [Aphanothece hegewaldii]PSF34997.1 hypothetical protein C7H19_17790 [Aphanothece hegewaldii CCALA 016]